MFRRIHISSGLFIIYKLNRRQKMERQDRDLAWMLQYENIAWYEDDVVASSTAASILLR